MKTAHMQYHHNFFEFIQMVSFTTTLKGALTAAIMCFHLAAVTQTHIYQFPSISVRFILIAFLIYFAFYQ